MALSNHLLTRVYGLVTGQPPFENAAGQTAFSSVKAYPNAPLTYIPGNSTAIWPLPNGYLVGNTYVYSVLELAPTGLNVNGVKLVTDQTATNVASSAS